VAIILKAIGSTIWEKAKAHTFSHRKTKSSLANGLQTRPKQEYTLKCKTQVQSRYREKNISQILTYCHPSTKSASQTQQESFKSQSKKCVETEHHIALGTFH
jgi:hypothetical protein